MARKEQAYDDIPGTFVFDAERSRARLRHQHVLHVADEGREPQGVQGERGRNTSKRFHLTPAQEQAILKRDYNRMLELGGNIYFTAKLGATDGHSFQHLAAVMTGSTQPDYAAMMLGGGRSVEGNRSRSGKVKPAKLIAETKAKAKAAAKSAAKTKAKRPTKTKSKSKPKTKSPAKRK